MSQSTEARDRLRLCTHPELYLAQLAPGTLPADAGVDDVVEHFLAEGAAAGLRVCALFNPQWYARRLADHGIDAPDEADLFGHWLEVGWEQQIVPTPLFEEAYYRDRHPGVRAPWPFVQYLREGCYQARFRPGPLGPHHSGAEDPGAQAAHRPLLLREMLHRAEEFDLRRTSWLEEGYLAAHAKLDLLESPRMRALVAKAAALEPLVLDVPPLRAGGFPPRRHHRTYPVEQMQALRRSLAARGLTRADTLILVPSAESAGAGPVPALAAGLAAAEPGSSVQIVVTDTPGGAAADPGADLIDLAAAAAGIAGELRTDMALDLVRGLAARRIVTVGSALGWDLITAYGRQLSAQGSLGAWLDPSYSGLPFQLCFANLDWVLVDDTALRDDLVSRYVMAEAAAQRLLTGDPAQAVPTLLELPRRRG